MARGFVESEMAFYGYQHALIDLLAAKGVVAEPEAVPLRDTLMALVPIAKSRCALRR